MGGNGLVDFRHGVARRMPRPGDVGLALQDCDLRLRAALHLDQFRLGRIIALRHQPAAERGRIGDGGRQADGLQPGRMATQPRQPERQQMAALRRDERMQFVEDHIMQILEEPVRVLRGDQKGNLFRRGQQNVRR